MKFKIRHYSRREFGDKWEAFVDDTITEEDAHTPSWTFIGSGKTEDRVVSICESHQKQNEYEDREFKL